MFCTTVILALGRLRGEHSKLEVFLGYVRVQGYPRLCTDIVSLKRRKKSNELDTLGISDYPSQKQWKSEGKAIKIFIVVKKQKTKQNSIIE